MTNESIKEEFIRRKKALRIRYEAFENQFEFLAGILKLTKGYEYEDVANGLFKQTKFVLSEEEATRRWTAQKAAIPL